VPSRASANFRLARARCERLLSVSTDRRLRPVSYADAEPALHAALATLVSGWEAYVESIVMEVVDAIAVGAAVEVGTLALLIKSEVSRAVDKFNTPNSENCRDFILRFTGLDIFPVMTCSRLSMPAHMARARLNEILKVRHAFAHGFAIPAFAWTTRYGTTNRLTKRAVREAQVLINEFVSNVDANLSNHVRAVFTNRILW